MAVGLRLNFSENTLDDYDKVCKTLNFPSDWPDGLLSHSSHETDGHLVVNDVWESRSHFDRFVQGRLQNAMGEAIGSRAREPQIVETPLHTFWGHDKKS
jgi:hypothetical protein